MAHLFFTLFLSITNGMPQSLVLYCHLLAAGSSFLSLVHRYSKESLVFRFKIWEGLLNLNGVFEWLVMVLELAVVCHVFEFVKR